MHRSDKLAASGARVIFTGIYRNEADTLAATLDSVKPVIDAVVIVDTGSTDGTQDVVRRWMTDNGVPGVVYEAPWPSYTAAKGRPGALFDFAEARNLAQALACSHATPQDWAMEFDACWFLRGGVEHLRDALASAPANGAGFEIDVRQPGTSLPYLRLRRVSACWPTRPDGFKWIHPIHEAIWREGHDLAVSRLHGVWIDHVDTTSKEARFARFERDLLVLADMAAEAKASLADAEPGTLEHARLSATLSRCAFYRGQTYENLGRAEEALAAYLERAALKGVVEDWAVALVRAGRLAHQAGRLWDAVQHWTEAHAVGGRPEPLWYASEAIKQLGVDAVADGATKPPFESWLEWSRRTAALALQAAQATKPEQFRQFVDPNAWSLATFGPAQSNDALLTRRLHLRLLGVGLPLDEDGESR